MVIIIFSGPLSILSLYLAYVCYKKHHHKQPANHGALQGAALKASMRKPRDNKPRHLKNSKAKGGGRSKKAVKKAFKKSGGAK